MLAFKLFRSWLWLLLPFAYLWFRLIDNLQIEWSTNPQYSFGWVVPLLCLGLLFRRWEGMPKNSPEARPVSINNTRARAAFFLLAFLYLPIRLFEAATPEWRPIQWALAVVAIGVTLCAIELNKGRGWLRQFAFPICFFMVAIPWPTLIEAPIIQSLTRANAEIVVDIMGIMGIPAVQHGNLIEVSSGVVGIDEACSGIRSFQSALMISLFLGEFYRIVTLRRLLLVPIAFVLAFVFNVCRTSFLTFIAAKKGVAAIATYHDPAGLVILLGCIAGTWGFSLLLKRGFPPSDTAKSEGSPFQHFSFSAFQRLSPGATPESASTPFQHFSFSAFQRLSPGATPESAGSPFQHFSFSAFQRLSLSLLVWLIAVEIGVQLWYYVRESHIVKGPDWSLNFPTNNTTFKPVTLTDKTFGLLRYDQGKEGEWDAADGAQWHAFYFNWFPGRVAGYLAKRHTPEICFGATGRPLVSGPDLTFIKVHNVILPIRQYLFGSKSQPIHVFHCRWEAGADQSAYVEHESARYNLLRAIWAGRGKDGQKVIEFVVTGIDSPALAKAELVRQLETLIQVAPAKP